MKKDPKLYDLLDFSAPLANLEEIKDIISMLAPGYDARDIEMVYLDVIALFRGNFPGFKASNTKYHDLEHTIAVVMAVARLMHGCSQAGLNFSPERIFLGISAALFHDVGLIQTMDDHEGSGAKYTIGHEQRSIDFMRQYLSERHHDLREIEDCSHLIMCTILDLSLAKIPFRNPEIETLGKIVGSADLMAQMADRHYLEKLLLLFQEFKEAGIPGVTTEFDLLKNTENFYENVAKKRMADEFSLVSNYMIHHFAHRWQIEKDLYQESIDNNIDYLRSVLTQAEKGISALRKSLRRGGITKGLGSG